MRAEHVKRIQGLKKLQFDMQTKIVKNLKDLGENDIGLREDIASLNNLKIKIKNLENQAIKGIILS